ncbi:MAG: DNA polymerase, partial [Promethearchaeota archaeon]
LLRKQGYVRNELGRYRRLPEVYSTDKYISSKAKRQAFNFLIQGLFADILRIAAINCLKLAEKNPEWDLKLLLLVHDEIVFECNEEYTEKTKLALKQVLETAYKLSVPLPVEINSGKLYGFIK